MKPSSLKKRNGGSSSLAKITQAAHNTNNTTTNNTTTTTTNNNNNNNNNNANQPCKPPKRNLQFEAAHGPRPCSITRSHLDAEGKLRRLLTYLENEPQQQGNGATTGFSTHNLQ